DKPQWWMMFDRAQLEPDELIHDLDSLGGLKAIGPADLVKRSCLRNYAFPVQETKLRSGDQARTRDGLKTVTITELDLDSSCARLQSGPARREQSCVPSRRVRLEIRQLMPR